MTGEYKKPKLIGRQYKAGQVKGLHFDFYMDLSKEEDVPNDHMLWRRKIKK